MINCTVAQLVEWQINLSSKIDSRFIEVQDDRLTIDAGSYPEVAGSIPACTTNTRMVEWLTRPKSQGKESLVTRWR